MSSYSEDDLKNALEGVLPAIRYKQLTRGDAWNQICNQVSNILGEYENLANSYSDMKNYCPQEKEELVGEGVGDCNGNHVWRGTCGSWECVLCGEKKTEPSEHSFGNCASQGKCDVCENSANAKDPYAICGGPNRYRPAGIDHHRGWYDAGVGVADNCRCECYIDGVRGYALGHVDPNGVGSNSWANSYVEDATTHGCVRIWTCERCGSCNASGDMANIASAVGVTATGASHADSGYGKYTSVDAEGEAAEPASDGVYCLCTFTCDHSKDPDEKLRADGCGRETSEKFDHAPDESYGKQPTPIEGNYSFHKEEVPCENGFFGWGNPSNDNHWCGWTTNMLVAHNWACSGQGPQIVKFGEESPYPPTNAGHWYYDICGDRKTGETNGPHQCKMENKRFEAHKALYGVKNRIYGNPQSSIHDISNECRTCDMIYKEGTEAHETSKVVRAWIDNNLYHRVTNFCTKCTADLEDQYPNGYPFYTALESHSRDFKYDPVWTNGTASKHDVYYWCKSENDGGCGGLFDSYTDETHGTQSWIQQRKYYAYLGAKDGGFGGTHEWTNYCERCEVLYKAGKDDCDKLGKWTLNPNTNGYDSCICSKCNGENYYMHNWVADNEEGHHCSNGDGHFYIYAHVWEDPSTSNYCVMCGYEKTPEPTPVEHVCKESCGCNDNTCVYGLKYNGDGTYTCKCNACQNGHGESCLCELINYMLCLKDYPRVTANRFKNAFVCSGYRWVNGDDPVYHVCASGFEGAFSDSLQLAKVTFKALTNCETKAFYSAFDGCVALKEVDFSALITAGSYSFDGAFDGCTNANLSLNFGSLETAGAYAFSGALAGTRMKTVSFPKLKYADSYSFADMCAYNELAEIESVSFPELEYAADYAFQCAFLDNKAAYDRASCTNIYFPKLKAVGSECFDRAFCYYASEATNVVVNFSSITNLDSYGSIGLFHNFNNYGNVVKLSSLKTVSCPSHTDNSFLSHGPVIFDELWLDNTPSVLEGYLLYGSDSNPSTIVQMQAPWYTCIFVSSNQLASYKSKSTWSKNANNLYAAPVANANGDWMICKDLPSPLMDGTIYTQVITCKCSRAVSTFGVKKSGGSAPSVTSVSLGHKWYELTISACSIGKKYTPYFTADGLDVEGITFDDGYLHSELTSLYLDSDGYINGTGRLTCDTDIPKSEIYCDIGRYNVSPEEVLSGTVTWNGNQFTFRRYNTEGWSVGTTITEFIYGPGKIEAPGNTYTLGRDPNALTITSVLQLHGGLYLVGGHQKGMFPNRNGYNTWTLTYPYSGQTTGSFSPTYLDYFAPNDAYNGVQDSNYTFVMQNPSQFGASFGNSVSLKVKNSSDVTIGLATGVLSNFNELVVNSATVSTSGINVNFNAKIYAENGATFPGDPSIGIRLYHNGVELSELDLYHNITGYGEFDDYFQYSGMTRNFIIGSGNSPIGYIYYTQGTLLFSWNPYLTDMTGEYHLTIDWMNAGSWEGVISTTVPLTIVTP